MNVNLTDLHNYVLKQRYITFRRWLNYLDEPNTLVTITQEAKNNTITHLNDITTELNRRHELGDIDMTPDQIWEQHIQLGGFIKSIKNKNRKQKGGRKSTKKTKRKSKRKSNRKIKRKKNKQSKKRRKK